MFVIAQCHNCIEVCQMIPFDNQHDDPRKVFGGRYRVELFINRLEQVPKSSNIHTFTPWEHSVVGSVIPISINLLDPLLLVILHVVP